MRRIARENTGQMKAGQDLVVAGYFALSGILWITETREKELRAHFSLDFINRIKELRRYLICVDAQTWPMAGACEWEEAQDGGILAALWNLSGAYETGITCFLSRLPILQEVIEICEFYNLNPYRLQSKGCYILAAENGGDLVSQLEKQHIPAAVVGKVDRGIKRIIYHGEMQSFLDRPTRDELLNI